MSDFLNRLAGVLEERKNTDPTTSYVASLYHGAPQSILDKIQEEADEVVQAGRSDNQHEIIHEVADLWFHTMVLLASRDLGPEDVIVELSRRFGLSGHDEKASRNQDPG
jgi:phosphoribosyl-ATP pyrophosphohydrolase